MRMTPRLKAWIVENCGIDANATDGEFRAAASSALVEGRLTADEFVELATNEAASEANRFETLLASLIDKVEKLIAANDAKQAPAQEPPEKGTVESKAMEPKDTEWHKAVQQTLATDRAEDPVSIRVKGAWEQYSHIKSAIIAPAIKTDGRIHPHAGQQLRCLDRPLETTSQRELAFCGAWCKWLIARSQLGGASRVAFQALPQHDQELIRYGLENYEFEFEGDGNNVRKATPYEQKNLIDELAPTGSQGGEAVPIVFDDAVIQIPLLHGELYPRVNEVTIPRGRRIEGVQVLNVTLGWGGIDATSITLFNTAAYVAAFDTTIYRVEGAIRIGLDFLSDTPIDFGRVVINQYGEQLLANLDSVIAVGNGTTQPLGVINSVTPTTVAWGGATTIDNYEALFFAIDKQERQGREHIWLGSETSYQRARGIPVGTADARRLGNAEGAVGGYESYVWMGIPYAINDMTLDGGDPNARIGHFVPSRYRLYRRRGLTVRTSTEGQTLIRDNMMLIAVTARYGGQQERPAATAARTITAPS